MYQIESDIEGYLVRRVESLGGLCEKFNPDLDNGMPDRLVMIPGGITVWVETKKADGTVRALQKYQHKRLRKIGQRVFVTYTKAEVDQLIGELRNEAKLYP